jgi:hypothetical protein
MLQTKKRIMKKNRKDQWKPSEDFLKKAFDEYLSKGGVIEHVIVDSKSYEQFMSLKGIAEF